MTVERVQPRFSADLDTRVEFKPEAIFIERTLTLHREKGDVFSNRAHAARRRGSARACATPMTPSRTGAWKAASCACGWSERAAGEGADRVFKIRTRIEPEKWTQLGADGLTFTLGDAKIDGAEKVTGYIALQADDSFRLEAEASETLERRDGRTTPVQGDYAWFRRAGFALKVKVTKRPGEVLAVAHRLRAAARRRARSARADRLPVPAIPARVPCASRVPEKLAQNFHFDGPQIAERNLAGDIWTIVFQKELTGSYALKITAQVPVEKPAAKDGGGIALHRSPCR